MGFVLLTLAALALIGASLLWRADSTESSSQNSTLKTPQPATTSKPKQPKTPKPKPAKKPKPTKKPKAHKLSRRARREWATANGFTYTNEDEFLHDEWTRGAAATGAPIRDVLTGTKFGHETRIADIDGTTVIGMGTGMTSDVVVDMRRLPLTRQLSDDLVEVAQTEGFAVFASEAGPAERMLDVRVRTALEMLPQEVGAVWFESEWVLAEFEEPAGWDAVFAPLALLADAARTLPPEAWPRLELASTSREMGEPMLIDAPSSQPQSHPSHPPIARPEEPLEMPTRLTGSVKGEVTDHEVGSDEVNAIGTGDRDPQPNDGTRVARKLDPPSIFGD